MEGRLAEVALFRTSGTVIKKLGRWLAQHGYVAIEDAALAVGDEAARNLPAAAKLATLLYDLTTARFAPREWDIEGRFGITNVESRRIWLRYEDEGREHGAFQPPKAAKLCRVGWTITGTVRHSGSGWRLVEAFGVYP